MFGVKVKAYAKLNLTLDITGTENGYHLLDSFVASIDMSDLIVAKKRKDKLVTVAMHGMRSEEIPPENNNALKAGEAFVKRFSVCGADVTVYKNIPMGAGLGGSSADAAGVLNAMAKLYGVGDRNALKELACGLGSDTAYMLDGGFCRMQGRGERLTPVPGAGKLYFLLLCPATSLSSGACYREYDRQPSFLSATENCIREYLQKNAEGVGRYASNALFAPAVRLDGNVGKALEEARSFSPLGASMTGSGSCVFALFETRELCEWAKSRYRGKFRAYVAETVEPEKIGGMRSPFVLGEEEKNAAGEESEN